MEQKLWYAVMRDREATDWGNGSDDLDTAKRMLQDYPEGYIAVIDDTDHEVALCIDEIYPDDY